MGQSWVSHIRATARELFAPELDDRAFLPYAAGAYLVLLFFVMFQFLFPAQAYFPFHSRGNATGVWRFVLCMAIFFAPLAVLLPRRHAFRALHLGVMAMSAAAVFYFGIVVSKRPVLVQLNDRAEALTIAINRIASGEFPYSEPTHLNGPITALSGSLLLAAPSVLALGRAEWSGLALIAIFVAVCSSEMRRKQAAIPLFALVGLALLNPVTIWELSWGSDLFWGTILLSIAAMLAARGSLLMAAVALALGTATRSYMLPLFPLWLIAIARLSGGENGRRVALLSTTILVAIHLPLIAWDSTTYLGYAPFGVSTSKLSLAFPSGDNWISDGINVLLPTGPSRTSILAAIFFAFCAAAAFRVRDYAHLLAVTSACLLLMLFFTGPFFLFDYLVLPVFPLAASLCLWNAERDRPEPQNSPEEVADLASIAPK